MPEKQFSFFFPDKENPLSIKEEFRRLFNSSGFGLFLLVFISFLTDAFLYSKNGPFLFTFAYGVIFVIYTLAWLFCLLLGRSVTVFFISFNFIMFCVFKEYYKINITPLLFYDIVSAFKEGLRAGLSNTDSLFDTPFFILLIFSLITAVWIVRHSFQNLKRAAVGIGMAFAIVIAAYVTNALYWAEFSLLLFPNVYMAYEQGMLYKITYLREMFFKDPLENLNKIVLAGNEKNIKILQTDDIFLSRLPRHIYLIQAESLTTSAITSKTMPFLSAFLKPGSFWVDSNHYHCLGSGNTDFMMMTDLIVKGCHLIVYFSYMPAIYQKIQSLPVRLISKGYQTAFYHSFEKMFFKRIQHYSKMGFQKYYFMEDYPSEWPRGKWGVSDSDMLRFAAAQTAPNKKTFAFIITANMHPPFLANANKSYPYPQAKTTLEKYLNAAYELDNGLKNFYNTLPDDSFVILYGDHNVPDVNAFDTPLVFLYKGKDFPIVSGEKPTGFTGTVHFINSLF